MSRISVKVRVRPESSESLSKGMTVDEAGNVISLSSGETLYDFPFDKVLSFNCSQDKIFKECGLPLIDDVFNGFNGTCLAYGQTGAGKTYTMTGPSDTLYPSLNDEGLVVRSANYLFQKARTIRDAVVSIKMSILEIYNETLIDLLRDMTTAQQISPHTVLPPIIPGYQGTSGSQHKLVIQESSSGVIIPNLCWSSLNSEEDVITYMQEVRRQRQVAEHLLNKSSSRSHIVYTFQVTQTKHSAEEETIISKLNLVDLAGSERVEKSGAVGHIQKEASYINKSLSFLEQVVIALGQSKRDHIPYRQSKLTLLLKDSLGGGNCNTLLLACIWPANHCEHETLSTLRFAARMKCIEFHPSRNSIVSGLIKDNSGLPAKLRAQINSLKRELNLKNILIEASQKEMRRRNQEVGDDGWESDRADTPASNLNHSEILSTVSDLMNEAPSQDPWQSLQTEYQIDSISQIDMMFSVMRNIVWEACGHDAQAVKHTIQSTIQKMNNNSSELSVLATNQAKIKNSISQSSQNSHASAKDTEVYRSPAVSTSDVETVNPLSYDDFLRGPGSHLNESYFAAKDAIRSNKQRQKDIIAILNRDKQRIDELSGKLESMNTDGSMSKELASCKQGYLAARTELELCKKQLVEMEDLKKSVMSTVLKAYEDYTNSFIAQ